MQLEDVTAAMLPGVIAAIDKGLTFQEMAMAFRLAAVREARRRTETNQRAAILLHMAPSHFNELFSRRALTRTSFKKGARNLKQQKEKAS